MTRKVHVTPGGLTAMQAKIGIVVAAFFLLFGLVFGAVVGLETPASEVGLRLLQGGFLLLWVVGCIAMIVFYARLLAKKTPQEDSLLDVHFAEAGDAASGTGQDFAVKLRNLEQLKREGLISESEYLAKREQILKEKW